jgi:hypothetical protein
MNSTVHIPWAVLELFVLLPVIYFVCRKYLIPVLFQDIIKEQLNEIGTRAITKLPAEVHLVANTQSGGQAIERQVQALLSQGFVDLGNYGLDAMPAVSVRMLFQSGTHVAAHLYEYKENEAWTELVSRYDDGNTCALSTLPDTGIESVPWVQTMRADKGVPTDQLYHQHLAKRPASGIKPVKASEAAHEFEEGYSRIMGWKRERGISVQEVARAAVKLAVKARAARSGA